MVRPTRGTPGDRNECRMQTEENIRTYDVPMLLLLLLLLLLLILILIIILLLQLLAILLIMIAILILIMLHILSMICGNKRANIENTACMLQLLI